MKKLVLMASAALLLAMPAAQAQKVNKEGTLAKLEKSDADIANVKKNAKAATWLNRGKVYYEAAVEPTKNLFTGLDPAMLELSDGKPEQTAEVEINGMKMTALTYPYYTAYVRDGKIVGWKQTQEVKAGALDTALEAYAKAYELDPSQASKIKPALELIVNYSAILGNVSIEAANHKTGAEAYLNAYEAQQNPAYGSSDPQYLYFAGYMYTLDGSSDPESFVKGAACLNDALAAGYTDPEGNIYYYLFHCNYGQKEKDASFVTKSKEALLAGIEKFPQNERILDGLLSLYTTEDGVGNPADLIGMIEKSLQDNPKNADMWFGLGRVYYKLKDYDKTIDAFRHVVELKPEGFEGNYFLGLFYTVKADDMNTQMSGKSYQSQAEYDADLKEVSAVYMQAVPYFEKAHEIDPQNVDAVDFLKSLSFRLRDEPGMSEKYEVYNELYKKMKGQN